MQLHKVILVLQLSIPVPPIIALQNGDILTPALTQNAVHIPASAHIAAAQRQSDLIGMPLLIIQQDLPGIIRRMVIIHEDLIGEIHLLHQNAVQKLRQITLHIVCDNRHADGNSLMDHCLSPDLVPV